MLRRRVLSLAALVPLLSPGLASAQDATATQPAQPPAAEPPAPQPTTPPAATPPAAQPAAPAGQVVVGGDQAATPSGRQERTEEIVVTGSRIRRKDLTTPAPVAVINKETIQASGKISIGDFLQALPEQGNTVNTQVNNGNDGSVRVALRSLGSQRTLVLVNGRRMVNGGTGADASPDLNTIPAAAVERIEILKDGGSAVYGSDAIAGVVNVILKKRFDGTEVSGYSGTSYKGDGTIYDLSAITGTTSEKGNILFSVGYQEQKQVLSGDRPWAATTTDYNWFTGQKSPTGNSSTFPEGRFSIPSPSTTCAATASPNAYLAPLCKQWVDSNVDPASRDNSFVPSGGTTPGSWNLYDYGLYNTNPTNYLITPNKRIQIFSTGDTNIGSFARGFFEASYVNRTSAQTLAPMPVVNNTIPTAPVYVSADSMYNPFGVQITSWRLRAVEFGDRFWKQSLDTFHVVTGVDGSLGDWASALRGWTWDVSFNYGSTTGTEENDGLLRMPNVANAVGPSMSVNGTPTCLKVKGDPTTAIPGCVPWDVLHGVDARMGAAGPLKDYLSFTGTLRGQNILQMYAANLSGDLFRLYADRPVALAVGADYRMESGKYLPDVITAALESSGNNILPTQGSFNVKEAYGEISAPIIGNLKYAEEVEASAALRYVDYNTFGSNTSYKLGARWSPFRDLSVRGTFSTAFRAPSINELYGGATDSYPSLRDPCNNPTSATVVANCMAHGVPSGNSHDPSTQMLEKWLGTPDLGPETADIYTVGFVVQPRWVPNLSVTLDYYNINLKNAIALTGAAYIVDQCYKQGNAAMCDLITRGDNGTIIQIDDPRSNRYTYKTAGLDFAVRYGLPTPTFGRFGFLLDGTILQSYKQIDSLGGDPLNGKGFYDLGALPTLKFNAGVTWAMAGFGVGLNARYIGSYKECATGVCTATDGEVDGVRTVSQYMPIDLFATYAFKSTAGKTSIAGGMTNVLNVKPPFLYNALAANSDPSTYDYLGRFFYVRLTQGF